DRYFFITSAHEGDQLGGTRAPPRARAEVFEFFYGYYRKGEIGQLEPGDQIVAQVKLPDSSKLLIFDMPEPGLAQAGGEEPPLGGGRGPGPAIGGAPPPPGEEGQPKGTPWDQPV